MTELVVSTSSRGRRQPGRSLPRPSLPVLPVLPVLIDEPVSFRLAGVARGRRVRLTASSVDARDARFESWAEYHAGAGGRIDPARQRPTAGTYQGVDPFGLWWSMRATPDRAFARDLRPIRTTVMADVDGRVVASAEFERLRVGAGVIVAPVRERGLVATLFVPENAPAPGVVVLGGSEGGIALAEELAALLATRGLTALAVAYFGMEGLPARLEAIPLEYLDTAAAWLLDRREVSGPGLGVLGVSRGAELALLFASGCPLARAVVGFAASGVIWSGFTPGVAGPRPAWTRGGEVVPFALPIADPTPAPGSADALALDACFRRGLLDRRRVLAAEIPLERIRGPVLLVSGGDDRMWPSRLFGEMALRRLATCGRRFRDRHLSYPGAGHAAGRLPGMPAPPCTTTDARSGMAFQVGGSRAANAHSARHAWPRVLAFLTRYLDPRRYRP